MSPHNYNMKFNGSNNKTIRDQQLLAERFDTMIRSIGKGLYSVSGLKSFYTRRFFERGIKNPSMYYDDKYVKAEQYIITNHTHRWGNIGSFPHIKN